MALTALPLAAQSYRKRVLAELLEEATDVEAEWHKRFPGGWPTSPGFSGAVGASGF